MPEGVWSAGTFLECSTSQAQVEQVLARMLAQARRTFEALEVPWPEDAFEALQCQGAQERLNLGDEPVFGDTRRRLLAVCPLDAPMRAYYKVHKVTYTWPA